MKRVNERKLANTVLYLLHGCRTRPGVTHLLKMLFYADYEHYRKHLKPITGAQYVALERGPVLDNYRDIFDDLANEGVLAKRSVTVQGQAEQKIEYLPQQEPDDTVFGETELEVLEEVIRRCGHLSGAALSHRTHLEGPWIFAWDPSNPGNPIPYSAFRWLDNMPDEDELALAKRVVVEEGLAPRVRELNDAIAA